MGYLFKESINFFITYKHVFHLKNTLSSLGTSAMTIDNCLKHIYVYLFHFFSFSTFVNCLLDMSSSQHLLYNYNSVSVCPSVCPSRCRSWFQDLDGRTGPGFEIEVPRWKRRTTTTNGGRNNFI